MLLIVNRGSRRRDDGEWLIATLTVLTAITVGSPYVWWALARDLGHGRLASLSHALLPVALAGAGASEWGWWVVPPALLAGGLVGLVAISLRARAELRRELREREQEAHDWHNAQ